MNMNNPNAKEYYNKINLGYEKKWASLDVPATASQFFRKRLNDQVLEIADVKAGEKAIEIGCGTGLVLAELSKKTDQVFGLDISLGMLGRAKDRLQKDNLVEVVENLGREAEFVHGKILLQIGDFKNLNLPNNYFDKIFSIEVLRYIDDVLVCLKNVRMVMAPEARFVFTLTNKWSAGLFPLKYRIRKFFGRVQPDELIQYFLTEKSLRRKINQAGLEIVEFKKYGFLTANEFARKFIRNRERFETACKIDSVLAKIFPFCKLFDTFIVAVKVPVEK